MFYFLNKHNVLQLVLAVPLAVWAFYTIFTQMTIYPVAGQSYLYRAFFPFLSTHPIQLKILASAMLVLWVLLVQFFFTGSKFIENQTFMPVLFSLAFVNAGHFLTTFTPAFFTVLFCSLIIFFTTRLEHDSPHKNRIYSAGILIAIASLFDLQAVWITLFMLLSLAANRVTKSKEIVIMFLGMLLVYVYLLLFFFMTDRMGGLAEVFWHLHLLYVVRHFFDLSTSQYVLAGYSLLLMLVLNIIVKVFYDNKLIVLRKRFVSTIFLSVMMVLMVVFSGLDFGNNMLYLLIPMTLVMSMCCQIKRRKFVHDVYLVALLVLLWI